jgi:hypothetical protein
MEAKLASMNLKSPGLKSNLPASPTARNFSNGMNSNFLSPDSATIASGNSDPAATLAQQRAKLKASNASHRTSLPALGSAVGDRNTWGAGSNQLGQVDERSSSPSGQELSVPSPNTSSRPKSTDFSGLANALKSPRGLDDGLSPVVGDSWASMVSTPLMPMFAKERNTNQSLDAAASKLNEWSGGNSAPGVPLISDPPKKLNRLSRGSSALNGENESNPREDHGAVGQGSQQYQQPRNVSGNMRNNLNGFNGQPGWNGSRSPALSNTSSRFNDDGSMAGLGVGGFGLGAGLGMGMPTAPGFNMAALAGMAPMSPFNNMFNVPNLAAMGLSPEQILTMQMAAAAGQLGQPGLNAFGMNMNMQSPSNSNRSGRMNMRSPGVKSPSSVRDSKKDEEDVDPKVLEDVPAWLRSLRLHKYTPNFEGVNWKEMVMMDEAALEAKGVAALGARRKMLKTFEIVRKKMGMEAPASAAPAASS